MAVFWSVRTNRDCLPIPRLVAARVNRVTFNAHILETGTHSYRLRTSKTGARGCGRVNKI